MKHTEKTIKFNICSLVTDHFPMSAVEIFCQKTQSCSSKLGNSTGYPKASAKLQNVKLASDCKMLLNSHPQSQFHYSNLNYFVCITSSNHVVQISNKHPEVQLTQSKLLISNKFPLKEVLSLAFLQPVNKLCHSWLFTSEWMPSKLNRAHPFSHSFSILTTFQFVFTKLTNKY